LDAVASDDALLAQAGAGDELALARLYDRYGGLAYGLALRVLRDRSLAEDAVQEGFLHVWRTASRFDGGRGTVAGWITTLVHRRAVDLVRRSERERCSAPPSEMELELDAPSLDEEASHRERAETVRAALRRLPAEQRGIIELAYHEGLTQTEIAGRLGLPLGTVKSRTFAGLSRLRALLADAELRATEHEAPAPVHASR
jgi:RNA polymerase sigma-70 factor (ECF subfamily)